MITIRNNDEKIGRLTRGRDLFCRSTVKPDSHPIHPDLVAVNDYLLENFGKLNTTSTWRSPAANKAAGGATKSQHMLGNAMDTRPVDQEKFEILRADIAAKGPHWKALNELGARGFGVYGNWVHIDVREGSPVFWNETDLTLAQLVEKALDPNAEDVTAAVQEKAIETAKKNPVILVGVLVLVYLLFFNRR
jgi:uncharacterized protein YcbK (DUF882 family)